MTAGAVAGSRRRSGFITRDPATGNLMLGGQRFRWSGSNATLALSEDASNYGATVDAESLHLLSHSEIDAVISASVAMNARVIRTFACLSVGKINSVQPTLGGFSGAALEPLDYAITQCAANGIRLICPLVDNYQYYFGGKYLYCYANGVTPDADATQFFTNSTIITSFKAHISFVLDHVNAYTGVAYKNEPTIMAWETGNELSTAAGWSYSAWTDSISQHIKVTKAAKQLVFDGHYGIFTVDPAYDTTSLALTYVDGYSNHTYDDWRTPSVIVAEGAICHGYGKAYYAGEYTTTGSGVSPQPTWNLTELLTAIEGSTSVDGDNFWQLLPKLTAHADGYTVHQPGDDTGMTARVASLTNHAANMAKPLPGLRVIDVTKSSVDTGTTLTVTMPTVRTVGNALKMFVGFWGGGTPACTGWTLDSVTAGTSARMAVFSRSVDGSETSTYSVTGFTDSDTRSAAVVQISGQADLGLTSTPAVLVESSSVWTAPSVTTTVDNSLVLSFFYTQSDTGTPAFAWGTGTQVSNFASTTGSWKSYESGISRVQATAGATGTTTITRTVPDSSANAAVASVILTPSSGAPPAAPAFGSIGTALTGTNTTCLVPVPASVATNDIIIVPIFVGDVSTTVTAPDGTWTEVGGSPVSNSVGQSYRLRIFWRRATGADSGTYAFTLSGSASRNAFAVRIPGAITTGDPFDVTNSANALEFSGPPAPTPAVAVTTTGVNRLLVFISTSWASSTPTVPSGFTSRGTITTPGTMMVADKTQASAGASGSIQGSYSNTTAALGAWVGALKSS